MKGLIMSAELDIINRVLTLFNQDTLTTLDSSSSEISQYRNILATQHRRHQSMANMYTNLSLLQVQRDETTNKFLLPSDVIKCLTQGYTVISNELVEVGPIPQIAKEYGASVIPWTTDFFTPFKLTSLYPTVTVVVRRLTPLDNTSEDYRDMIAAAVALEHYGFTRDYSRIDAFQREYNTTLQRVQKDEFQYKRLNLQGLKNYGRV
jgi:hypothetical protein